VASSSENFDLRIRLEEDEINMASLDIGRLARYLGASVDCHHLAGRLKLRAAWKQWREDAVVVQ
jgi:hypothetical protein